MCADVLFEKKFFEYGDLVRLPAGPSPLKNDRPLLRPERILPHAPEKTKSPAPHKAEPGESQQRCA